LGTSEVLAPGSVRWPRIFVLTHLGKTCRIRTVGSSGD
jgi:hypothetical protein